MWGGRVICGGGAGGEEGILHVAVHSSWCWPCMQCTTFAHLALTACFPTPCCRIKDIGVLHEASVTSNLPQSSPIGMLFQEMMRSFDDQVSRAHAQALLATVCAFSRSIIGLLASYHSLG